MEIHFSQHLRPRSPLYEIPEWGDSKVGRDHLAQVSKALYSLPTRFIGKYLCPCRSHSRVLLRSGNTRENPSAQAPGWPLHRLQRLPPSQERLCHARHRLPRAPELFTALRLRLGLKPRVSRYTPLLPQTTLWITRSVGTRVSDTGAAGSEFCKIFGAGPNGTHARITPRTLALHRAHSEAGCRYKARWLVHETLDHSQWSSTMGGARQPDPSERLRSHALHGKLSSRQSSIAPRAGRLCQLPGYTARLTEVLKQARQPNHPPASLQTLQPCCVGTIPSPPCRLALFRAARALSDSSSRPSTFPQCDVAAFPPPSRFTYSK